MANSTTRKSGSPSGTRLILWRHGITEWNAQGWFQGQADVPLNPTGVEQAVATAPTLAAMKPDALYSSPSRRAHRTAAELAAITNLPVTTNPALMEIDVGTWSGLSVADAQSLDPAFAAAMAAGEDYRRSPFGETFTEAGERITLALRDIAAAHPGETVAITSHGGVIRMGIGMLLGWDFRSTMALGGLTNCAWAVVVDNGIRWRLEAYNVSVVRGVAGPSSVA